MSYKPPSKEYFLRRWRITFIPDQGDAIILSDSELKEKALHCEFECENAYTVPCFGAVTVFNLSWNDTSNIIRTENAFIRIEAGYKGAGNFGVIWEAPVIQYIRAREQVVDWTLTFSSVNTRGMLDKNWVRTSIVQSDPRERIEAICNGTHDPDKKISYQPITAELSSKKLERQRILFGNPGKLLEDVEKDQRVQVSIIDKKLVVADPTIEESSLKIVKSPSTGLIGTPQQSQKGINFTCLLDPRLGYTSPVSMVQIKDVLVQEQKLRPQAGSYPAVPLDVNGNYKVMSARHHGSTRGNDWYSEVMAINTVHNLMDGLLGSGSRKDNNSSGLSMY